MMFGRSKHPIMIASDWQPGVRTHWLESPSMDGVKPLFTLFLDGLQRLSKRVKFVRDIVKEVAGLAPYEKRVTELLKVGRDKRALKLCKRKVCPFPPITAEIRSHMCKRVSAFCLCETRRQFHQCFHLCFPINKDTSNISIILMVIR